MELDGLESHPWAQFIPIRLPVNWEFTGEPGIHPEIDGVTGRNVVFIIEKSFSRFERFLAKILRAPKVVERTMHPVQSMLWELIDNQRDFFEICTIMDSLYHEDISPVSERIKVLLEVFVRINVVTVMKPMGEEE